MLGNPKEYYSEVSKKLADDRKEALELLLVCAKDVVEYWPQFSFKTIRIMAGKMETLKQAVTMALPYK